MSSTLDICNGLCPLSAEFDCTSSYLEPLSQFNGLVFAHPHRFTEARRKKLAGQIAGRRWALQKRFIVIGVAVLPGANIPEAALPVELVRPLVYL